MEIRDLVLVDGVRTPMAEYNGSFAEISAIDLGAHAARALFQRTGVDPSEIDHTVVGNALQTSPDAIYGAPANRTYARPTRCKEGRREELL
ncbi:MAG TPA: hypothetical protein VLX28_01380 [Thermoanaerobaculia bacterium]|nr:hypothetical protein [Thermoanaerobaculia bacterium]